MGCIAYLLYGAAVIFAVTCTTIQAHDRFSFAWLLAYLCAINIVAFAFYAYDKIFATLLEFLHLRVPEKVLIWELAFPGGVLGAFIAMCVLRHKVSPKKLVFQFELLKAFAIQMTLLSSLLLVLLLSTRG